MPSLDHLDQIGLKYGTDQSSRHHDYLNVLERWFSPWRTDSINVLEIGVAGGAGLRTWRDYFSQAEVWGMDHNEAYISNLRVALDNEPNRARMHLRYGNAHEEKTWEGLPLFQVVIDDGGHESAVIIETLGIGFHFLAPGALWVVEDLHAIYAGPKVKPVDAIDYLESWIDEINEHGAGQCGKPWVSAPIKGLHFYKSLCIIERA